MGGWYNVIESEGIRVFRIAYVLDGNSVIGKIAVIIILILIIDIPLLSFVFIENQIQIHKIKKYIKNKKKGIKL